jgi:hypothetical protein
MKQFNISLLDCLLAKIVWQMVHMTFNIMLATRIPNLKGNWMHGVKKKRFKSVWELVLYYGSFGTLEMTLCLTNQILHLSCRLSREPRIGSVCGPIYSKRSCGKTWTLGVNRLSGSTKFMQPIWLASY